MMRFILVGVKCNRWKYPLMESYRLVAASRFAPTDASISGLMVNGFLAIENLSWYCLLHLNPHAFDFNEGDFIGAAVIELSGAVGGVISHRGGLFEGAAVL
jgi:hypothetical protein